MGFISVEFFIFIGLTLFFFHVTKLHTIRLAVLIGSSFAFIASFFTTIQALLPFASFVLFLLVSVQITLVIKPEFRSLIAKFFMFAILAAFLILKGYIPFGLNFQTIGISYVLFRGIQLMGDAADGALEDRDVTPEHLLLFFTSFLTFAAGPIQHYEHFSLSLQRALSAPVSRINRALLIRRSLSGAIKLCLLTPLLMGSQNEIISWNYPDAFNLAVACCTFLLYIYFSFSGYMDWVIAFGVALNFDLPDNFDRPHRAENFLDLWNRWHLTLSKTFRIYVFNPLVRFLMMRISSNYRVIPGVTGYLVVFFLLGYWHGTEVRFAIFGLLIGVLASLTKFSQELPHSKIVSRILDNLPSTLRTATTAGFSLGLLALCLIFTWPDYTLKDAIALLNSPVKTVSTATLCICFAMIFCAFAIEIEEYYLKIKSNKFGEKIITSDTLRLTLLFACLIIYNYFTPEISSELVYYQRF